MNMMDTQQTHGKVRVSAQNYSFQFTTVYGLHTVNVRRSLWGKLIDIHVLMQEPWLIMVDFNVIIGDINRIDGNTQEYEVCDFIDFMFDTGLHKLQSVR